MGFDSSDNSAAHFTGGVKT